MKLNKPIYALESFDELDSLIKEIGEQLPTESDPRVLDWHKRLCSIRSKGSTLEVVVVGGGGGPDTQKEND